MFLGWACGSIHSLYFESEGMFWVDIFCIFWLHVVVFGSGLSFLVACGGFWWLLWLLLVACVASDCRLVWCLMASFWWSSWISLKFWWARFRWLDPNIYQDSYSAKAFVHSDFPEADAKSGCERHGQGWLHHWELRWGLLGSIFTSGCFAACDNQ